MKTDKLIDALSTNLEPVGRGGMGRWLVLALVAGGALTFCMMLATVGPRLGGDNSGHMGFLASKLLFALSVVITGAVFLIRSVHPGQDGRRPILLLSILLLAAGLLGVTALPSGQLADWSRIVFDAQWMTCLCCIPLFTVIPFAALILALRRGAPTNLRRTGAIAGLVAGAVGAAVYAFHCPQDSLLFIAVWYGVAIAFCASIGALLGPRLLRW